MKVGFLQYDIAFHDYQANLRALQELIPQIDFELLVLPELFTSGYLFKNRDQLLTFTKKYPMAKAVEDLSLLLEDCNPEAVLVGTIPELEGDLIYNTGIAIGAKGLCGKQRKRHLTKLEKQFFTPGEDISPIKVGNTVIGIVTCFDAWFPELFRLLVSQGVQLICQPANFGGPWTPDIMRVRAMENRLFCIVANRIGTEKTPQMEAAFRGESQLISPDGQILVKAGDQEAWSVFEINPSIALNKSNIMCDDLAAEWQRYSLKG